MKLRDHLSLGFAFAVGLLSGCSGSDNVPVISSGAPIAATDDDQRVPQSDEITSEEAALVSQADADPDPPQKPDI